MDSTSDSCELDSISTTESLNLFADEFRLHHVNSPADSVNAELSKRATSLEVENERLRIRLESARIEANAINAANRGLKSKIAELFVEAQSSLQEKLQLQDALKDANRRLMAAENATKWYRTKLHHVQASEKARRTEIDTYRNIMKRHRVSLTDMTERCERFASKYSDLAGRFKREKRELSDEIERLRAERRKCNNCCDQAESPNLLEFKLVSMEECPPDCQTQLQCVQERLTDSESLRNASETSIVKYRRLLSLMEENAQKLEAERSEIAAMLEESKLELEKMRCSNEQLRISVLSSKHERAQVQRAIVHLRSQLEKMLAQYRLLKSRNKEAGYKENKQSESQTNGADSCLLKKLQKEKRRVENLENQLRHEKKRTLNDRDEYSQQRDKTIFQMRDRLRKTLEINEELKEQLRSKATDESIDEGYGDGSIVGSTDSSSPPPPPPPHLDSVFTKTAIDVLARSKNMMIPLEASVDELRLKIIKYREYCHSCIHNAAISQYYDTRQMTLASPHNNTRSVA